MKAKEAPTIPTMRYGLTNNHSFFFDEPLFRLLILAFGQSIRFPCNIYPSYCIRDEGVGIPFSRLRMRRSGLQV